MQNYDISARGDTSSYSVPETSTEEMERILQEQQREKVWYKHIPSLLTSKDIEHAVEQKKAVRLSQVGKWYKISDKTPSEFWVLDPQTAELLSDITTEWGKRLISTNLATEEGTDKKGNPFLAITSLARTVEYQQQLQEQGYPAADGEDSTHTKLAAFDIWIGWLRKEKPELYKPLEEILKRLQREGKINLIEETSIEVLHIARNPNTDLVH
ncbi:MAG TPA: DUF5715 family protein [Patescibacteria group bacterium]|nr:DUF5715 family protein [Patescibacteria group bacterium]